MLSSYIPGERQECLGETASASGDAGAGYHGRRRGPTGSDIAELTGQTPGRDRRQEPPEQAANTSAGLRLLS